MGEKKAKGEEEESSQEGKKLDISGTQVTGGALASVTAAFLGSHLGLIGTLWGAGLTSVVITVGGALYQRSMEKTREKAREKANIAAAKAARKRAAKPTPSEAGRAEEQEGQPADPDRTRRLTSVAPADWQWPGGERVEDPEATRRVGGTSPKGEDEAGAATTRVAHVSPPVPRKRIKWAMVAVTSAAIFGLGMLVVTGFEGLTGKPLSGGEKGTTLGQVFKAPGPSAGERVELPAPAPTTAPEPSSGAQPEGEVEPSAEQPSEPSASSPAPGTTGAVEPAPNSPAPTAEVPTGQESTTPQNPLEGGESTGNVLPTEPKRE